MSSIELPSVTHDDSGDHGLFALDVNGQRLAKMTYAGPTGGTIVIQHTEVDDALRGTGAGKKLLAALIDWARATHTKVNPMCPFAKAAIDKTPEFQDVLA